MNVTDLACSWNRVHYALCTNDKVLYFGSSFRIKYLFINNWIGWSCVWSQWSLSLRIEWVGVGQVFVDIIAILGRKIYNNNTKKSQRTTNNQMKQWIANKSHITKTHAHSPIVINYSVFVLCRRRYIFWHCHFYIIKCIVLLRTKNGHDSSHTICYGRLCRNLNLYKTKRQSMMIRLWFNKDVKWERKTNMNENDECAKTETDCMKPNRQQ